jgi:hypothetical protein
MTDYMLQISENIILKNDSYRIYGPLYTMLRSVFHNLTTL